MGICASSRMLEKKYISNQSTSEMTTKTNIKSFETKDSSNDTNNERSALTNSTPNLAACKTNEFVDDKDTLNIILNRNRNNTKSNMSSLNSTPIPTQLNNINVNQLKNTINIDDNKIDINNNYNDNGDIMILKPNIIPIKPFNSDDKIDYSEIKENTHTDIDDSSLTNNINNLNKRLKKNNCGYTNTIENNNDSITITLTQTPPPSPPLKPVTKPLKFSPILKPLKPLKPMLKPLNLTKNKKQLNNINNINGCCCNDTQINNLEFHIIPQVWSNEHDFSLKMMLKIWNMHYLFDTLISYVYTGAIISQPHKGKYYKRTRNDLENTIFCPCWYKTFKERMRIIQFGYCPGTTQFALKFTRDNSDTANNNDNYSLINDRYRFETKFIMNNDKNNDKVIPMEIFDMNIAEFPTMIPSYLETYDPHVIILIFDVTDRSSFNGITKMRKRLLQIYESLEETIEYNNSSYNRRNSIRRGSRKYSEIIQQLFNNNRGKKRSGSSSIIASFKRLSIKKNSVHKTSENVSDSTDENEIGIDINEDNNCNISSKYCGNGNIMCYYHTNNDSNNTISPSQLYSVMPPIIIVGIQANTKNNDRTIKVEEGLELAKEWECPYIETSSKTGINVRAVFLECIRSKWLYDTYPESRSRSKAVFIT